MKVFLVADQGQYDEEVIEVELDGPGVELERTTDCGGFSTEAYVNLKVCSTDPRKVHKGEVEDQREGVVILPEPVAGEIVRVAQENNVALTEVVRVFLKLGLLVEKLEKDPDTRVTIHERGLEKELRLWVKEARG